MVRNCCNQLVAENEPFPGHHTITVAILLINLTMNIVVSNLNSPRMRETSALICVRTFQTQRFLLSTGKISRSGFFQIAQRSVSFEIGWKKIHASAIDTHENCQHLNRCNIKKSGKSNAVQEPYSFNFQKCKLPGASNWQILPNPDISLTADDFSTFFCQ